MRTRLAGGEDWTAPGAVWSGPIRLRPGVRLQPGELVEDLRGAGYMQVERLDGPGEFLVEGDAVLVRRRPADLPGGGRVPAGDALVTFREGRVATVSPEDPLVLPPTRLATLRGPDNALREPRPLEDFPPHLQRAVLAMEDAGFWDHPGVSPMGILRALVVNLVAGRTVQGGSTLTQQLAKNLFLSPERTLDRKAREALLALALERTLSKAEILALYLNTIYWGQASGAAIHGAAQAARAYFGRPVERLDVGQAATLAGIISSPNRYSPLRHPERARARRDLALDRMVELGWLAPEAAARASEAPLQVAPAPLAARFPWVVDAAIEQAELQAGEGAVQARALQVHTTIDPALQRSARAVLERAVQEVAARHPEARAIQGALVALDPRSGAVLALVGGAGRAPGGFNRALHARRQVGSVVKPLLLLAALDADPWLAPAAPVQDTPLEVVHDGAAWRPRDFDGTFLGEIPLRRALAQSRNLPFVRLGQDLGWGRLAGFLGGLGLRAEPLPSTSLGAFEATPLEIAAAYTAVFDGGRFHPPRLLAATAEPGDAPRPAAAPRGERVASAEAAAMVRSMMETVIAEGTGRGAARRGVATPAAGKTGTTDGGRDAWMVGGTRELVVAAWIGVDRGGGVGLSGGRDALPAWAGLLAAGGAVGEPPPLPEGLVLAETCVGGWTGGVCETCVEDLWRKGREPPAGCEAPSFLQGIVDRLKGRRQPGAEPTGEHERRRWWRRRRGDREDHGEAARQR